MSLYLHCVTSVGPQTLPLSVWFVYRQSRLANDSVSYGQASTERSPTGVVGHSKIPYASNVPIFSLAQEPSNVNDIIEVNIYLKFLSSKWIIMFGIDTQHIMHGSLYRYFSPNFNDFFRSHANFIMASVKVL